MRFVQARMWVLPRPHPLVATLLQQNGMHGMVHFAAPMSTPALAYMDDHMVLGRALMPAAAMLEVSSGALQTLMGDPTPAAGTYSLQQGMISDVSFTSPLMLESARLSETNSHGRSRSATYQQQMLQVVVDPCSGAFQVQSQASGGDAMPHSHAHGTLGLISARSGESTPMNGSSHVTPSSGEHFPAMSGLASCSWLHGHNDDESSAGPLGALAPAAPHDGYLIPPQAMDATLHLGVTHPDAPAKIPTAVAAYAVPLQACVPEWGVGASPYASSGMSASPADFLTHGTLAVDLGHNGLTGSWPVGSAIRGMGTKAMRAGAAGRIEVGGQTAAASATALPQIMYEMVGQDQVFFPYNTHLDPAEEAAPSAGYGRKWAGARPTKCRVLTPPPRIVASLRGRESVICLPGPHHHPHGKHLQRANGQLGSAAALLQTLQQLPAALEAAPAGAVSFHLHSAGDAPALMPTQQLSRSSLITAMMGSAASEMPTAALSLHTHSPFTADAILSGYPLLNEPQRENAPSGLHRAAAGQGTLAQPRLLPSGQLQSALQGHSSFRVVPKPRGSLQSLVAEPLDINRLAAALKPDEVIVAVQAVGLNFRDVLNVLGAPHPFSG